MSNTAKTVLAIIVVIIVIVIIALAVGAHNNNSMMNGAQTVPVTTQDTSMNGVPAANDSTSAVTSTSSVDSDMGNINTQMNGLQSDTASANSNPQ